MNIPVSREGEPIDLANPPMLTDKIRGYAIKSGNAFLVPLVEAVNQGYGDVAAWLDEIVMSGLDVRFPNVVSARFAAMLLKRGWTETFSNDPIWGAVCIYRRLRRRPKRETNARRRAARGRNRRRGIMIEWKQPTGRDFFIATTNDYVLLVDSKNEWHSELRGIVFKGKSKNPKSAKLAAVAALREVAIEGEEE